jgi:predicted ATPase
MAEREAILQLSGELAREHHLVRAQGLARFGDLQLSLYRFLHNLFQQYLYGNLDEAERTVLHRDVGQVLETLFTGQTEEVAAQIARHFEEAGIPAKAAAYRLQAGNRARRMSANLEAVAHLKRGLELLTDLPQGPERLQLELGLQTSLGTTLIATRGYASPQMEQTFARARELCRALGDPPQVIPVLYGLCMFRTVRAELKQAYEEGEQLLLLAQRAGDVGYILGCHAQLGGTAMYLGRFDDARAHLEQAITLYDPSQHRDLAYHHGQDPCVTALSYLSRVLWFQGYSEQAMARQNATLDLARGLNHPHSLGLAISWASVLNEMMRQWPECQTQAEEALQLASQGHFPLWQATAAMVHATAIAYQGHVEEGIAELSQGLAAFEETGARLALPYFRARLAELYLLAGRQEDGLNALEESLYHTEQVWWLPEQYRLRAELLLLAPGAEAEAEASLRQALDLAKSQKSRSLELRAAMSLARLLQKQGRAAEGRDLLAECYAWFTEGFETRDLQEARELLEVLQRDAEGSATRDDQSRGASEAFLVRPPRAPLQSRPSGAKG